MYELANALRFYPHLNSGEVRKAVRSFLDLGIMLRDPADDAEDAVLLDFRHGFTVYDAAYAALAQAEGIPLITADYKFHAKAPNPCRWSSLSRSWSSEIALALLLHGHVLAVDGPRLTSDLGADRNLRPGTRLIVFREKAEVVPPGRSGRGH